MSTSPVVADATERNRFEAHIDGKLAGYADYIRTTELVVYHHTEVDGAYEGMGIGSTLARTALDDARRRGLRVLATCPFIHGWIERHPEYQDLVYQRSSRVSD